MFVFLVLGTIYMQCNEFGGICNIVGWLLPQFVYTWNV